MKKLKKISIDFYITGLILIAIVLFIILAITVAYTFYYFNLLNESKFTIDKYIESTSLKRIQLEKAQEIINYRTEEPLIDSNKLINPFRIIQTEEEEE